jgi:hypothetical protein
MPGKVTGVGLVAVEKKLKVMGIMGRVCTAPGRLTMALHSANLVHLEGQLKWADLILSNFTHILTSENCLFLPCGCNSWNCI